MNIFVLDEDPVKAAQMAVDKHVVKQTLETAQLLCSPFSPGEAPYRRTHYNHPCSKWVRESTANYEWLIHHGQALAREYTYRYGKVHKSEEVINWCQNNMEYLKLPSIGPTNFPMAMPVGYHSKNIVKAYRGYYRGEKAYLKSYRRREIPEWWNE